MNIATRITKLEAKAPPADLARGHRVIGYTDEECQAGIDSLIASGEAKESDIFVCRLIVGPPKVRD